ncbi:MAG: DUF4230 domain-containing protein [Bacteroidetes bacterium]|nr:DUF4230 domain-containing protein [Bacteroidota bacterium]
MRKYYIALVLILVIVMIVAISAIRRTQNSRVNISRTAVITELRDLNRLETAAFTIEKVIDAQNATSSRIEEFLFGDKLLLIAHGEVIAGIDLSQMEESGIQINEKSITLTLPPAQILVTSLDNTQTKVYDRRTGILAKGDKDLEGEARKAAEQSIRVAACEGGILDQASENARKQLTALFRTLSFENISIVIPTSACN